MADRHIAEGGQRILRQQEILTPLELKGCASNVGETLLTLFNETKAANPAAATPLPLL